jgi:hypothetical protein
MSFDIKYDRDGNVVPNTSLQQQLNQAAEQKSADNQTAQQAQQQQESIDTSNQEPSSDNDVQDSVQNGNPTSELAQNDLEPAPIQQSKPVKKTPADSFRELAQRTEKAERERDELLRKLYEREASNDVARSKQQRIDQPQPDEDFNIDAADDDLAEIKHVKSLAEQVKILKRQAAEERVRREEEQEKSRLITIENKIKSQYPDFDKVVSGDNIELLKYRDPEFTSGLDFKKNPYATAISTYLAIKESGIYQGNDYAAEKKRVQENISKPRLSPAVSSTQSGDSPLSKANAFSNGLTPELQAQLRKEMEAVRKAN